jgi:hypothetical protein
MIETARVQFASLNAGIVFWSGWLQSASRFAQTLNTELSNLGKEGTDTDAMLSKITDSSREFLRNVSELPESAAIRFKKDVAAATARRTARTRAARAKD